MPAPLDHSIICPVLIGRAAQLDALDRRLALACDKQGQAVLIAGEAGIGKSRLVAEVSTRAVNQGFMLLRGRCFEPDRVLPYAPLLDLLRAHLGMRPPDTFFDALGPSAAQLAGLLPELAAPAIPTLDPDQERHRVAQAFVRFFLDHANTQPLLVVIEDVHWSDDASLEVLLTLVRRSVTQPIMLLLTYRDTDAPPNLTDLIATLERERLASEIALAGMHAAEVDAMLRAIFKQWQPIRSDFLTALYTLTEGNPFFIEEVLKALITTGDIFYADGRWDRKPLEELSIPRTLQLVVRRRADLLNPQARRLLTWAAVAGRRFDFGLLQRLTAYDEATLLGLIKVLIAAQLVVEETADTFAFRHALTREALYADLLARERRVLHGQIAVALEVIAHEREHESHDPWVADLAYHFYMAELWPQALEYARQAAELSRRRFTPRAVIEQLSRAIIAARHVHVAELPELYRARAQMYELLGAFEPAHADYQAALDGACISGDRRAEWQILLDLGFLWAERDYVKMGEYRRRALTLARTLDDPISLGYSLNRVGNWYLFVEQPHAALQYHQEALALFDAAHDRRGLAATYDLLGVTHMMSSDVPTGVAYYERAVALFRDLGDYQGLITSLANLAMRGASYPFNTTVCPPSDRAACMADGEEALWLARDIGWRSGEANVLIYLAYAYGARGEYAPALECARAGLVIAQEIEHGVWLFAAHLALGVIAYDLLDLASARHHLDQALALTHEIGAFFARIVAGFLASVCVAQYDGAHAEKVLSAALDPATPMETRGQRLAWCARAELALSTGNPALALQIADGLIASAAHAAAYGPSCVPRLWHLRGLALLALGRAAEAESALLAADTGAAVRGFSPLRWRIQAGLGRLYQGLGRRKQAEAAFAIARAIIQELATSVPDAQLRAAFLHATAAQIPRTPNPTPRRAAKHAYGGLTEREREIATLIARGQTNRAIAATLVVGERTVETHVSNILAKLDYTTRAQIVAWAIAKGLAGSAE
jgi:DNA-binding CsgD family transcriptional regulator